MSHSYYKDYKILRIIFEATVSPPLNTRNRVRHFHNKIRSCCHRPTNRLETKTAQQKNTGADSIRRKLSRPAMSRGRRPLMALREAVLIAKKRGETGQPLHEPGQSAIS